MNGYGERGTSDGNETQLGMSLPSFYRVFPSCDRDSFIILFIVVPVVVSLEYE